MGTSKQDHQDRDIAILRGLFESRIMTTSHITEIYFDGRRETAKKALQKLKGARLIGERSRFVNEPSILYLSGDGLAALSKQGILTDYPSFARPVLNRRSRVSDITLRHEIEAMDVKAAFHGALKSEDVSIDEFTTWPALYQFKAKDGAGRQVIVKPDGLVRIHCSVPYGPISEHTFFLEVDRSTESQDTLVSRARCFLDYYKSGGFAARNGADRSNFKDHPFRVLMVFKSAERRNNMAERLLQLSPPILSLIWLSTFDEVSKSPFGAIWIRPMDYRDAVKDTVYDVERRLPQWGYRRQTAREAFVEERVIKQKLIGSARTSGLEKSGPYGPLGIRL